MTSTLVTPAYAAGTYRPLPSDSLFRGIDDEECDRCGLLESDHAGERHAPAEHCRQRQWVHKLAARDRFFVNVGRAVFAAAGVPHELPPDPAWDAGWCRADCVAVPGWVGLVLRASGAPSCGLTYVTEQEFAALWRVAEPVLRRLLGDPVAQALLVAHPGAVPALVAS